MSHHSIPRYGGGPRSKARPHKGSHSHDCESHATAATTIFATEKRPHIPPNPTLPKQSSGRPTARPADRSDPAADKSVVGRTNAALRWWAAANRPAEAAPLT